ncbi:hypothetical protein LCGC14_1341730, partial [marine sediment metagenome]
QGETIQGAYEAAMQSSSKQLRSMKRHVVELLNSLGKPLLDAFGDVVTGATDMLKIFRENIDSGGILETVMTKIGETISNSLGWVLRTGGEVISGLLAFTSTIDHAIKYGELLDDWFSKVPKSWQPFTKYLAYVTEDGDTLNDFLQEIPKNLQPIARVMAELFQLVRGQGSFKDLIMALFGDTGTGPISALITKFEELSTTIREFFNNTLMPFIEENEGTIKAFFRNIGETILQVFVMLAASAAIGKVIKLITSLANPFTKLILIVALLKTAWETNFLGIRDITAKAVAWITEQWEKFGPGIIASLTTAWETIKGLFDKYWPIIKQAVSDGIQFVQDLWETWGDPIIEWVTTAWENIKEIFFGAPGDIEDSVNGLIDNIKGFWEEWGPHVEPLVQAVWDIIEDVFNASTEFLSGVVDDFLKGLEDFWEDWGPTITEITDNIWEHIKGAFERGKEKLKDVMDLITAVLEGRWKDAGVKAREIWDNNWEGIKESFNTAKENLLLIIENIIKLIKEKLEGFDLFETGKNIVNGLIEGIKSLGDSVGDAILDIGKNATDFFDGFFGINSDSKLMIERGKNIIGGLKSGIGSESPSLLQTFEEMARSLANVMSKAATPQAIPQGAIGGGGTTHNTEINPSFDFGGTNLGEGELMEVFELLRLLYGNKSYG